MPAEPPLRRATPLLLRYQHTRAVSYVTLLAIFIFAMASDMRARRARSAGERAYGAL